MPTNPEFAPNPSPTHADIVARLDLMEAMIAEGRATTARFGWIFVLWGIVYLFAMTWCSFLPFNAFAWPVSIIAGVIITTVVKRRQRLAGINLRTPRAHSVESVWQATGVAVTLFAFSCVFTHQINSPVALSGILFLVGLAHATSAMILRWAAQGAAAAVWWIAGIAALFFTAPEQLFLIFMLATLFGMVFFGLYAMWLERRTPPPAVAAHA